MIVTVSPHCWHSHVRYHTISPFSRERTYCEPTPTIPNFVNEDPQDFASLKVALNNVLPVDATERFKYQVLVDHLNLEEALLIADSYSNSRNPYCTATPWSPP